MSYESIRHHRELIVWQRSMTLIRDAYALARTLPVEERFGMASQHRRASLSIPSNIAEGHARIHRAEYVHHLSMARGSLAEVETIFDASSLVGYHADASLVDPRDQADEVRRMLGAMIYKLRA